MLLQRLTDARIGAIPRGFVTFVLVVLATTATAFTNPSSIGIPDSGPAVPREGRPRG